MTIRYQSQKIAQNFFTFAVVLFLVQVLVGIIAAIQFINPDIFILNFNTIRTLHINALVVWLLAGLMGATYYVVPEESETEVWSYPLAQFQFWATVGAIALVVLGYIWRIYFLASIGTIWAIAFWSTPGISITDISIEPNGKVTPPVLVV